ncbi:MULTISPECIES: response regulator transcription factor [unclassified Streptomyces]|uniref:response regulator transcription factor n=1 Tax=unclassified Streptomyces TaxID=2593676 RepID=UPI001BAFCDA9|nr:MULTISPECIES: response regulator transcription factor [unclassified Streptomyces]MDH6454875.1 DNA-binding response OmpR family regulator [Streptomyces sp. SAI-119]MDH6494571.1 DNA-binding response OmpR family regulator [Streptomyces sp. SAI-149]QUC58291.1 response regulator transcription factor [Streptomyces sp. A2-16]
MRILLADGDTSLAECVTRGLRRLGHEVQHVATGNEVLRTHQQADVVLLDLMIPGLNGLQLCREIRAACEVPVLALSSDRTEATRVLALRAGADDCLDKPYGFRELVARVEAVVRRSRTARSNASLPLYGDQLHIDALLREARVGDRSLGLTEKEFDLLQLLVARADAVVSREEIMAKVWGDTWNKRSRTVDTHVSSLRRKLGREGRITTVRGVGFRLALRRRPSPAAALEQPPVPPDGRRARRSHTTGPLARVRRTA